MSYELAAWVGAHSGTLGQATDLPIDGLRLAAAAPDSLRIEGRRRYPALGLGVGLATLFLCYVAFFFGQTRCDAEHNPHHPATCTLDGNQPTVLMPVAAFLSLAIFLFSLTTLSSRTARWARRRALHRLGVLRLAKSAVTRMQSVA